MSEQTRNREFKRLETQSQHVSNNSESLGPIRHRSVCIPPNIPAPSFCQLETRPTGHADRCIYSRLAGDLGECLPAICPNWSMLTPSNISEGRTISPNNTSVADPALVPIDTPVVHRQATVTTNICIPLNKGQSPTPSWKLLANVSKQQEFQQKLKTFCWPHGGKIPTAPTPQLGVSGLAGLMNKRSIPFQYF
jgi:hypothetical protein